MNKVENAKERQMRKKEKKVSSIKRIAERGERKSK